MRVPGAVRGLAAAAAVLALAAGSSGCRKPPRQTPEEVAYQFRDVMPYSGITDAEEGERLAELLKPYLLYISAEDFPGAAAGFEAVAKRHPDMPEARLLQGISLVLAERPQEAVAPLESVVRENPRAVAARWWLAKALFQSGRRDEALVHVREVSSANGLYAKEANRVLETLETPT